MTEPLADSREDRSPPLEYTFYPHQTRTLELSVDHDIVFTAGAVRNGKTRTAIAWCMGMSGWGPYAKLPPPGKPRIGWIVVPSVTPLWEHVKPEWESMWGFKESGGLITHKRLAPTHEYTVMCPDGIEMIWQVKSAQDPDNLRAASIWAAWLTEAAMMEEEVYSIVQQRVIASGGRIFMETSPFGLNWFPKRVMDRAHYVEDWFPTKAGGKPTIIDRPAGDKRIAGIMGVTIEANESIDPERIKGLRGDASSDENAREYDGRFFAWAGLVWRGFKPEHILPSHPTEEDLDGAEIFAAMDFGWEHPFAHLWIAKKGKTYIVLDEYRQGHATLKAHAERLLANDYHSFVTWRYADPSAALARAEMMDLRISSTVAENDVELGVNCVAQLFESGNLFISPRCVKLVEELGIYHRDDKGKIVKLKDDLADCLRYGCYSDKVHGGGFTLPHFSPNQAGRMQLQSDAEGEIVPDETIPLAEGGSGVYDSEESDKEMI
jgi:hypothetical protein